MQRASISQWRQLYDNTASAPSWLEAHRWTYGPSIAQATAADVRRKLDLRPEDAVLEVGAGTGAFLMELLYPEQHGVALDFCESLIRQTNRLGVDEARVKMVVAEGASLPFRSDAFDKVLCYSVAQHFPDHSYARRALEELFRVCRSGGIVLLGDICGVMERHRKRLARSGLPSWAIDAMLLAGTPLRALRWLRARRSCLHWSRTYRRRFFERTLGSLSCEYEFLDQEIPGRSESQGRFDVRIIKKKGSRHLVTPCSFLLWTATQALTALWPDLGPLFNGQA
jgi:ubiquinone/menaquinone biosynthesis C-methylase UbiE